MGLFTRNSGPIFLKENSDASEFIAKMQILSEQASGGLKQTIEKQVKLAKYGEYGEQNVAFELRNSGMDMYILHDICLEIGEMSAQIDYIVITKKHVYVIECKNLIGNIEIDSDGNFIRTYELFKRRIREGIYSPITQNKRHLQVLKEIGKSQKSNFLTRRMFENSFDKIYKSVVVLSNPKTYLNARYAKGEVKEQVIRADQLIAYIGEVESRAGEVRFKKKEMLGLAELLLKNSQPNKSDYARRYEELIAEFTQKIEVPEWSNGDETEEWEVPEPVGKEEFGQIKEEREELVRSLRTFRLQQSRKENMKAYYIFNDAQMEDLIRKRPKTREELLNVSGFGKVKVEKYGDKILELLNFRESMYLYQKGASIEE